MVAVVVEVMVKKLQFCKELFFFCSESNVCVYYLADTGNLLTFKSPYRGRHSVSINFESLRGVDIRPRTHPLCGSLQLVERDSRYRHGNLETFQAQ